MKTIYRYEIPIKDLIEVDMPQGARILPHPPSPRSHTYGETIEIWAHVDTERPVKAKKFRIFGTGQPIPGHLPWSDWAFIGTVVTHNGAGVWHLFEVLS